MRRTALVAAVPVAFLGYFFLYPLGTILVTALEPGSMGEALSSARVRGAAWFTVWQAVASTVLTVLFALPLTAVISRFDFPGRSLVRALVTVPFVLPTVVVGSAFIALGARGSVWAILAAHVFFNTAVVVRTVSNVWARLDPDLAATARVLGAGRLRTFTKVTLPLLAPSIAAAASIVFLFCFTSFGVVLLLGDLGLRTLEVEIYRQAVTFLDLSTAGAVAVLQLVGVIGVMVLYQRIQERRSVRLRLVAERDVLRRPEGPAERALVSGVVGGTLLGLAIPLAVLVARSFRGGVAGWRFLADPGALATRPAEAIGNSLGFALVAALVAVAVGGLASVVVTRRGSRIGRWFDVVLMLPLGTSAVTIGFGFLLALDVPIDLRTSILLVPIAHALVAVPFVVRSVVPTLQAIRDELREAAAVLGADPRRVWREIDLPLTLRALAVGGGFAAAVSLGEFGATAFLARPESATIPTLIFRLLSRPGTVTFTGAMALSVVLMLATTGLVLAMDRFRTADLGTF